MGKIYKGKVVKIMEFGAFVNFRKTRWTCTYFRWLADNKMEYFLFLNCIKLEMW